ncbi:phage tail tip fiber protein, partial [Klebsiella quasipneumoniae]|uniref:phage tail tip fiber protein n=1 Tax=Klebsiella quasipneumoniae TaxID=1463165 RepID=UPI0027308373
QVTILSTTVDGNTSTLQQQAQSIGGLSAEWTLKLDINGRVSGIGLASDSEGVSDFTVLTDRFSILDANDPTKVVLGTVNGQT